MDLNDLFDGSETTDSLTSDRDEFLSEVEFGEAGSWELQRGARRGSSEVKLNFGKGKVFANWHIDTFGEYEAGSIACGFFAKRKGRVKILKDANCDKKYDRRSDKIISTGKGPKYDIKDFLYADAVPGYGWLKLKGFSSVKKINKEKESNLNYEFELGSMASFNTLALPISPKYMKEFTFSSESGMTIDLFEEMHAERQSL